MTQNPAPGISDRLHAALAAAQARWQLFPGGSGAATPVVVGVSGGVDSICLLHLLLHWAPTWGLALHVGHVDHRLRPDSSADARFVAAIAVAWGLPFHLAELDASQLRTDPTGIEAAARQARYAALGHMATALAGAGGVAQVAVAHHADDQAETILMHLVQGGGLHGLGGMRPVSHLPAAGVAQEGVETVRLVRPLLRVRRADLLAYAAEQGLAWRDDSTNLATHLLRNRLRHQVLPLLEAINPSLVATLGRNAGLLAEETARLDQLDQATLASLVVAPPDPGRMVIDLAGFQALAPAARRGVLRCALAHLGADLRDLGFEAMDSMAAQAGSLAHSSGPHPLAGGLAWTLATGPAQPRLSIHRQAHLPFAPDHPFLDEGWRGATGAARLPAAGILTAGAWQLAVQPLAVEQLPPDWRQNPDPWLAYVDGEALGGAELTTAVAGAVFAPLGLAGRHKLLGDLFTDRKITPALRTGWPLLVDRARGRVLWVCGMQLAHEARITDATRRIVRLAWQRASVTGENG